MYKDFIKKNYKILLDILNCLKVGVYITDGDGNTVFLIPEHESLRDVAFCAHYQINAVIAAVKRGAGHEHLITVPEVLYDILFLSALQRPQCYRILDEAHFFKFSHILA